LQCLPRLANEITGRKALDRLDNVDQVMRNRGPERGRGFRRADIQAAVDLARVGADHLYLLRRQQVRDLGDELGLTDCCWTEKEEERLWPRGWRLVGDRILDLVFDLLRDNLRHGGRHDLALVGLDLVVRRNRQLMSAPHRGNA
jgi:hypothetical protein